MTDEHDLHEMVGGIVRRAERRVDVDRELAAFHERRLLGSAGQRFDEPLGRRRGTLLAVAASTVLVIGAGMLMLARRGGDGITTGTDAPPATTLAPPTSSAPSTTDGGATTTNAVTPTLPPLPAEFSFVEPAGGVVAIAADAPLQPATLGAAFSVPGPAGHGAQWTRVTDTSFAAFEIATGEVTVFDVDGTVVGSTTVPITSGDLTLRSIAVGPQSTVYALYARDLDPTLITASTLSEPTRTIASWQPGAFCEFVCLLTATDTGFAWEGGTVPYVDANGDELGAPARPVDQIFTTDYSSDAGAIPTRVDIVGPEGSPAWHLRIDGIEFNNDLGTSFVRQPDGSFTTTVQLFTVPNDDNTRRSALLWLTAGGRVAAIDAGSVPGLLDVVATADGRLIGVTSPAGDGVFVIGELTPTGG